MDRRRLPVFRGSTTTRSRRRPQRRLRDWTFRERRLSCRARGSARIVSARDGDFRIPATVAVPTTARWPQGQAE